LLGLPHLSARGRVWPLLLGVDLGPLLLLTGGGRAARDGGGGAGTPHPRV